MTQYPELSLHFVFVLEAHSSDEWPVSGKWRVNQHRTIRDRITQAGKYYRQTLKQQIEQGQNMNLSHPRFHYYCDLLPRSNEDRERVLQEYCSWKQDPAVRQRLRELAADQPFEWEGADAGSAEDLKTSRAMELLAERITLISASDSSLVPPSLLNLPRQVNPFNYAYHAWPLRAFVLDRHFALQFVSFPSDVGEFLLDPLKEALANANQAAAQQN